MLIQIGVKIYDGKYFIWNGFVTFFFFLILTKVLRDVKTEWGKTPTPTVELRGYYGIF